MPSRPRARGHRFERFRPTRREPMWCCSCPSTGMVCRIQVVQEPEGCTVHLAGCLTSAHVTDLFRACGDSSGSLRIDLTDLLSLDAAGFAAIQRLTKGGA